MAPGHPFAKTPTTQRKSAGEPAKSATHMSGQIRDLESRICPAKFVTCFTTPGDQFRPVFLYSVVENDADCVTVPRPDAVDAVPQVYAIRAARTLHGPVMNCENNAISLTERHDHRPALHAWALLRHDELSTGEVRAGVGQQNSQLEWEDMLAVDVLVQAVVVATPY
jgi:hypothetical protein